MSMFAIALTLAAPAAPTAADLADGKCAVAMITASEQVTDPKQKAGLEGSMLFFLGKIVARSGSGAAKPALDAAAAQLDTGSIAVVGKACSDEMQKALEGL